MNENAQITVLVVDDSPENISLLSRILKISGYGIQTAAGGAEAIESATKSPPDLIILDIKMPLMDGIEACYHLKADPRTSNIPIIFISALGEASDKARAFKAGGVDYIVKPFEYDEVQARVETHLAMRRLQLELEEANRNLAARVDDLTLSHKLLAERESKLRAFVAALPNLSFIMDENGRYLEVMASDTSLLVAPPDELVGRLVEDLMPAKEAAKIVDAIRLTLETGSIQVIEYKIPILAGGECWFEARLACMERNPYGQGKVVMIATEIGERIRLYQEIQRLANEDVLTGCFNRRHFMEKAADEIQRSIRYKKPLSLLMMDIDHFKRFNDGHGHQAGDKLLCSLVTLCQKEMRCQDILGRYGGEEFVVLMPETSAEGALTASERLHDKIEKMVMVTPTGELSVTVSMGVATFERGFDEGRDLDMLVYLADKALYAAKDAGRNCVRATQDPGLK
jgi:two-component system, cell cycle response regulator